MDSDLLDVLQDAFGSEYDDYYVGFNMFFDLGTGSESAAQMLFGFVFEWDGSNEVDGEAMVDTSSYNAGGALPEGLYTFQAIYLAEISY